jgi:hypothetical protein
MLDGYDWSQPEQAGSTHQFFRSVEVGERVFGRASLVSRIEEGIEDAIGIVRPQDNMSGFDPDASRVRQKVGAGLINVRYVGPSKLHWVLHSESLLRVAEHDHDPGTG